MNLRILFSLFSSFTLLMLPMMGYGQNLNGAWALNGDSHQLLLIDNGYFSWTSTNNQNEFVNTLGGLVKASERSMNITIEFSSEDRYLVGESFSTSYRWDDNDTWSVQHPEGYWLKWERIPEVDQGLAGVWRITGRKSDGEMHTLGRSPRKTYKLLTAGHFQWIAMNTDTGEFFGTGGGIYTFKGGKYIENIGFFSRDNSRVGAKLDFDGKIVDGDWHHSGKSSKGDPIYEIWSKEKF